MKIGYDNQQKMYLIKVEHPEDVTWVSANTIAEAKEAFIKSMESLFESAICMQLNIERGCDKGI